jgi:hypothetical protein
MTETASRSLEDTLEEKIELYKGLMEKEIKTNETPNWSFVSHTKSRVIAYEDILALLHSKSKEFEDEIIKRSFWHDVELGQSASVSIYDIQKVKNSIFGGSGK